MSSGLLSVIHGLWSAKGPNSFNDSLETNTTSDSCGAEVLKTQPRVLSCRVWGKSYNRYNWYACVTSPFWPDAKTDFLCGPGRTESLVLGSPFPRELVCCWGERAPLLLCGPGRTESLVLGPSGLHQWMAVSCCFCWVSFAGKKLNYEYN